MYVLPDADLKVLILAIEADVTLFPPGAVVRLDTTNFTPGPQTVLGDFTELTALEVPGYAPAALGWAGAPIRKNDGSWEDQGLAPIPFGATSDPAAPVPVYNWYATDAGGTTLIGSGHLDVPFTFSTSGDGFTLEQVIRALQANGTEVTLTLDMEME